MKSLLSVINIYRKARPNERTANYGAFVDEINGPRRLRVRPSDVLFTPSVNEK